jgi:hypothetical protein
MPITAADLRWFQSERMTDQDDGGGRLTSSEILFGAENQIFDDISDVDRAAGDVSIRKVYASVASTADDKYLDAGVVVLKPPADQDVSVVAFSTGNYYDEREDLANRLESQIVRGGLFQGWLWGDHVIGQRAVTLWQRMSYDLPVIGQRLELVKRVSSVTTETQVLWITRIVEQTVERVDGQGSYQVRMVTCEIAEPLRADYIGVEPSRVDPASQGTNGTLVYDTRYNPGAVNVVGARPLAEAAQLGDYTVKVDSIYSPLIPTAFAEAALADINPNGDWSTLIPGRTGTISWSTTADAMKPGAALFLGGPVMPGSLVITVSGIATTDQGGKLMQSGVQVGTIDYSNGICTWLGSCPNTGTTTKSVAYTPAAVPARVADTDFLWVTVENRGFVWVKTLTPIPAPGSLRVSYRTNNEWYTLVERGDGTLSGADSAYGSGTIDYGSGTVTITTGALPDPESSIMYAWGVAVEATSRGGVAVDPLKIRGQSSVERVIPGSVTITWPGGSLTDDAAGNLTGTGGTGRIWYATGEWEITPTNIPASGAEFTVSYDSGVSAEETFAGVSPSFDGTLSLDLAGTPIAGSVRVEYDLFYGDQSLTQVTQGYHADDAGGGVIKVQGSPAGTIDYATGEIEFNGSAELDVLIPTYGWSY